MDYHSHCQPMRHWEMVKLCGIDKLTQAGKAHGRPYNLIPGFLCKKGDYYDMMYTGIM